MSPHNIITAVPLSFHADGSLDVDGCRIILEYVARSGVQGALVLGTTGEFPALSLEERNRVAQLSVEVLEGIRVIIHVGAASLFEVTQLIDGARQAGATEIAVLTPYYLPAPPEQVYDFFEKVSEQATGLDIYAYLFSARTGIPVDEDLMARIAGLPGMVGVKISGEPLETIRCFRKRLPEGFDIYTGADGDFARASDAGADGVISGVASALAKPFLAMRQALLSQDRDQVAALQRDVDEAVSVIDGSPARMRHVHRIVGHPVGTSRMPIPEPDMVTLDRLARATARFH